MNLTASLLAALAMVVSQEPPAQDPGRQVENPDADLGTIEVTGERPFEDRAEAFIEEVATAPRGRGLARWDHAICVGAANMDRRYAQYMIDRVSMVALELGLEIGEPGCRPNIMIAAAADADELAMELVKDEPRGFRPAMAQTDLGSRALEEFQTSDAPIRWWHVSLPVMVDTGDIAIRLRDEEASFVVVRDASRLRANVRDDLARVVVILDTTKIAGVPYGAISDYVALVALAQIDPAADPSAWPSILNLFGSTEPPAGLTDWDRGYLQALYGARRDRARPSQQAREIVGDMARSHEAEEDAAAGGD